MPVAEGAVPGRGVRDEVAEGEHVGRRGYRPACHLLGGHEGGGAEHRAGPGQRGGVRGVRDAEVDDARAVGGEQHVGRLEVTVHQPGRVDRAQPLRDPAEQAEDGRLGERPVLAHGVVQRGPAMYAVASHGTGASGSASTTGAV